MDKLYFSTLRMFYWIIIYKLFKAGKVSRKATHCKILQIEWTIQMISLNWFLYAITEAITFLVKSSASLNRNEHDKLENTLIVNHIWLYFAWIIVKVNLFDLYPNESIYTKTFFILIKNWVRFQITKKVYISMEKHPNHFIYILIGHEIKKNQLCYYYF